MADLKKRLQTNVAGPFFVDSTCIDCDTCRQLAPGVFAERGDYSAVVAQPTDETNQRQAYQALLACPTGSIGVDTATGQANRAKEHLADFPLALAPDVYYLGFNSPKSFGANSYFITHPDGNWIIDAPKFLPHLAAKIEAMGGARYLFLTHQDDVADAEQYARHFGATRIIHQADLSAQPEAEWVLEGNDPITVGPDIVLIPTPGHTEGHVCLLYQNRYLFTGDHLCWSRETQALYAFRRHCWHSWQAQIDSMSRLMTYEFEWILPGHGQRIQLPPTVPEALKEQLLTWMRAQA